MKAASFSLVALRLLPGRTSTSPDIVKLQGYDWPGNIRELRNLIERAVIISRGGPLDFDLALTNSAPPPPSFFQEAVVG
jgi:DNA-binding NtrC family response regulator